MTAFALELEKRVERLDPFATEPDAGSDKEMQDS